STIRKRHWQFFTTTDLMEAPKVTGAFRGMGLPRSVVDKIYRVNAQKTFFAEELARVWTAAGEPRWNFTRSSIGDRIISPISIPYLSTVSARILLNVYATDPMQLNE